MKHIRTFESFVLNERKESLRGKPSGFGDKDLSYSGPGFEFIDDPKWWNTMWNNKRHTKHTAVVLDVLKNFFDKNPKARNYVTSASNGSLPELQEVFGPLFDEFENLGYPKPKFKYVGRYITLEHKDGRNEGYGWKAASRQGQGSGEKIDARTVGMALLSIYAENSSAMDSLIPPTDGRITRSVKMNPDGSYF